MKKMFPDSLLEFSKMFETEESCRDYLYELRYSEGFSCPKCGEKEFWWTARQLMHCKKCGHQDSLRKGTVMESSKKPLRLWFYAIFLISFQKQGISAKNLQHQLGFGSYQTAWLWLQKIRRAMVREDREKLSGEVEVDEAFFGGEAEGKRGRGAENKVQLFIAAEVIGKKIGRIRMECIPDASGATLSKHIASNISSGSTIKTDGFKSYSILKNTTYIHQVENKTSPEMILPKLHLVISLFKRWALGVHQGRIEEKHLQHYLDEFVFRFNRRTSKSRGKVFRRVLEQAICHKPKTYKEMVAKPIEDAA